MWDLLFSIKVWADNKQLDIFHRKERLKKNPASFLISSRSHNLFLSVGPCNIRCSATHLTRQSCQVIWQMTGAVKSFDKGIVSSVSWIKRLMYSLFEVLSWPIHCQMGCMSWTLTGHSLRPVTVVHYYWLTSSTSESEHGPLGLELCKHRKKNIFWGKKDIWLMPLWIQNILLSPYY